MWRLPAAVHVAPKGHITATKQGRHWTLPSGASEPLVPRPVPSGKGSHEPKMVKGMCERCGLMGVSPKLIEEHLQTSVEASQQQQQQLQQEKLKRKQQFKSADASKPKARLPAVVPGCDASLIAKRQELDSAVEKQRNDDTLRPHLHRPVGGDKFGEVLPPPAPGEPGDYFVVRACLAHAQYRNAYWLYLVIPQRAKLQLLDDVLRWAWVDCCMHLSSFEIIDASTPLPKFYSEPTPYWADGETPTMADECARLDRVFAEVTRSTPTLFRGRPRYAYLEHTYDFGSSIRLMVECVGWIAAAEYVPRGAADIIAHNLEPVKLCEGKGCGTAVALYYYESPTRERQALLCQECLDKDDDIKEEGLLIKVSTSPRMGHCGYCYAGL